MNRSITRGHFDHIADDYYRRNYREPKSRHERGLALRRESCLEMVSAEQRILDLGCGPGALAVPLAISGKSVVAFDFAPKMVAAAREQIEQHGASAGYCVGDAIALPFADASFDAVVTTGVLEYVPEIGRAISEISRVLRRGGTLVATVTLPRRLERMVAAYLGPLVLRLKGRAPSGPAPWNRGFTQGEFDRMLAEGGFAIAERRFSYFTPFPFDALAPRLVSAIDRSLGARLARIQLAREHAKTYAVKATRT